MKARNLAMVVAGALLAAALPVAAHAATPAAPSFSLTSTLSPTHLIPGDESGFPAYSVVATNVGAAPTDGTPVTLTDTLPAGVSLNPSAESGGGLGFYEDQENNSPGPCEVNGPVITCTATLAPVQPGENVRLLLAVNVAPNASGVAVNEATVSGGGAPTVSTKESAPISTEPVPFGFQESETYLTGRGGAPFTQAGGHPYQFHVRFQTMSNRVTAGQEGFGTQPAARIKDAAATLPRGFVVNPNATPVLCTEAQLEAPGGASCPNGSAVGTVRVTTGLFNFPAPFSSEPVYNVVPPPGYPAALAFNVAGYGIFVHLFGGVNSAGEYQLTASSENIPGFATPAGLSLELWGNPSEESHDYKRASCAFPSIGRPKCLTERLDTSFLTMPSSCSANPLVTTLSLDSYEEPGKYVSAAPVSVDGEGNPIGVDGCNALQFAPTITAKTTTSLSDSPTGLNVTIHQPQDEQYEGLSTADLKDVKLVLPAGLTLNPSAGNGLAACSNAQIGYQPFEGKVRFAETPQSCPDASKIGTLEVKTPLLTEKLPGTIYLAKPYENPFGNLTSIYLAIESPKVGIIVKLAGKVDPNPQTGQLTATFTENPELPIEDIETHFFEGPRAALVTPLACGTKTTSTTLVPWSTPEGADANPSDSFQISVAAPGRGACPASEAGAPDTPSFSAGTLAPQAGSFSPFLLKLARADGSQRITAINTTLPAGLTGKLAGIPYCTDAQIAHARSREAPDQGAVEQASPSCPVASEVGTVSVGAGAGITPLYVSGHAYLAGPYKGAALSLVTIVPAVAGPFDLGDVVTRIALNVDPGTAQIHAVSDPLPTIIQGVPLDVRSIDLRLGRPNFTVNPTSCEPKQVSAATTAATGQVAQSTSRFQVGGCSALAFKPKLAISLKGPTKRTGHPALKAVVTYPKKGSYANIASAQVSLPHSEFLDQGNIGKACTKPVLLAGGCPAKSIYGKVRAWTPLLEKPLEGPVYLVGGYGYKLPALVAELNGQIRILLVGKVDTDKQKGIRNTFEAVPDAPVERFVLELKGGKKYGLLENSENVCKKKQVAGTEFKAQNGKVLSISTKIANSCKGKSHRKGKKKHGNGKKVKSR